MSGNAKAYPSSFQYRAASLILILASTSARGDVVLDLVAANPEFKPLNQLRVSGNACGPAALLNAFRFGNTDWQRASNAITGAKLSMQVDVMKTR